MIQRLSRLPAVAGALLLAGCALAPPTAPITSVPPTAPIAPVPASPSAPAAPLSLQVVPFPPRFAASAEALAAFRRACPKLARQPDPTGLTRPDDWAAACADPDRDSNRFFRAHFTPARLGTGKGLATGYFEPEIVGFAAPVPGSVPVLARPPELVDVRLADWGIDGGTLRGLQQGSRVVRAPDRRAIDAGAFRGRGLELAFADRIDYFFLQIQGSGRLRMPDGSILRLGYAGQNGWPYVAIGRLLKERLSLPSVDMAGIRNWLRAHPQEGIALMEENPSYVFMRVLDGADDGPIGSLGVPLLAEANVAADPATTPPGTPVWLDTVVAGAPWRRLLVAADSGGAIKGENRFDIFFGSGSAAGDKAGALQAELSALLLLPNAAAARLQGQAAPSGKAP